MAGLSPGAARGPQLLLVSLPWAQPDNVSIQLGSLKAYAARSGVDVRARHYYKDLVAYLPADVLWALRDGNAGEFLSVALLHPEQADAARAELARVVGDLIGVEELLTRFDAFLGDCLDDIVATVDPGRTVVGMTTSIQQIVTALLVAGRLKRRVPGCRIVLGGAIMTKPVATGLLARADDVDVIVYGEGEEALTRLLAVDAWDDTERIAPIPNLVYRRDGRVVASPHTEMARLGEVPVPDYDEYFTESLRPGEVNILPKLAVETSRGCFFDKCEFCNLNSQWIARYRAKTDDQVYDEIRTQVARYRSTRLLFVDTNVANRRHLFRRMADDPIDYHGWAEVSGHLKRRTFLAMRDAGITDIQVGIESFATSMLDKYRKGVTAMRNMEMLKWCAELDVELFYNIILDFPDEAAGDREENVRGMRFAKHFAPPAFARFILALDSPYERRLRSHGGTDLPIEIPEAIRRMLPEDAVDVLGRLLLTFVGVRPAHPDPDAGREAEAFAEEWRRRFALNRRRPGLTVRRGDGFAVVTAHDGERQSHVVLHDDAAAVYLACMTESLATEELARATGLGRDELEPLLDGLERAGILYSADGRHLALACLEDARAAGPRERVAAPERALAAVAG